MRWDDYKREFVLSTGKRFEAYAAVIGLRLDGNLDAMAGYYDAIDEDKESSEIPGVAGDGFTLAEREEIAAFMSQKWKEWARIDWGSIMSQ